MDFIKDHENIETFVALNRPEEIDRENYSAESMALLPDGRILTGGTDYLVRIWNIETNSCELSLRGHCGEVTAVIPLQSGNFASGSQDNTIRIWDTTGTCLEVIEMPWSIIDMVELDISRVAVALRGKVLRIWNIDQHICEHQIGRAHDSALSDLIVLSNKRLVSSSVDGTVKFWTGDFTAPPDWILSCNQGVVHFQEIFDDRLAIANKKDIIICNLLTRSVLMNLSSHERLITSVILLQDGRLASSSHDDTIRIWDLSDYSCDTVPFNNTFVNKMCVLERDGRVVAGMANNAMIVLDFKSKFSVLLK